MSKTASPPPKLYTTFKGFLREYRPQLREYLQENAKMVQGAIQEKLCTPAEAEKVLLAGSDILADLNRREEHGEDVVYLDEWKTFTRCRRKEPGNKGGF